MSCSRRTRAGALAAFFIAAAAPSHAAAVTPGIDVLLKDPSALRGRRVGLITDRSGLTLGGRPDFSALTSTGVDVAAVFSPESSRRVRAGLASTSTAAVYLDAKEPQPSTDSLKDLDVLVFDMQDSGARFDEDLSVLAASLRSAAKAGLPLWVLDRPNPVKGVSEGPLPSPGLSALPLPLRHGLTPGEAAKLIQGEQGLELELKIVKAEGWKRGQWYDQTGLDWNLTEPELRDADSALLYPAMALLAESNLSVGRGTPLSLKWIGAPWLKRDEAAKDLSRKELPGLRFLPSDAQPEHGAFEGQELQGLFIDVTDRDRVRPFDLFVHLSCWLRDHHAEYQPRWEAVDKLLGGGDFRRLYEARGRPEAILKALDERTAAFEFRRQPYLLYP